MQSKYNGSERHRENARLAAKTGSAWQEARRKERVASYDLEPKLCERELCRRPLSYDKKANRFCCSSCAAIYNTSARNCAHSEETKSRIRAGVIEYSVGVGIRDIVAGRAVFKKTCEWCKSEFATESRRRRTCSDFCAHSLRGSAFNAEELTTRGRLAVRKAMRAGKWKGWSGRGEMSFPERYVQNMLISNGLAENIEFQRELHVDRFSIDFAFVASHIALEVDGKQHEYPRQKDHDLARDQLLEALGWTVFRIKWSSIKTEAGRANVHEQFAQFLDLLAGRCQSVIASRSLAA